MVQAATIPIAGVIRPMVVFTGRDMVGQALPHWLYPARAEDMARLTTLVKDMTALAVRAAAEGRTVE